MHDLDTRLGRLAADVRGAAMLGGYWFGETDATVYLGGGATPAERAAVRRRLHAQGVVDRVYYESKAEAYARMRERYRTKPEMTRYMTVSGMAESFRVRLDAPEDSRGCSGRCAPMGPAWTRRGGRRPWRW
jgi:FtsX extracellular domain